MSGFDAGESGVMSHGRTARTPDYADPCAKMPRTIEGRDCAEFTDFEHDQSNSEPGERSQGNIFGSDQVSAAG